MHERSVALCRISPPSVSGIEARPRLFIALDELWSSPMLWIGGPPGSGKTALLASYLSARRLTATWCRSRSDSGDGPIGGTTLRDQLDVVPQPSVVIIEDSHQIADADLVELAAEWTRRADLGGHLVLVGRGELPASLVPLIPTGVIAPLAPSELRFTPEETLELAAGRHRPRRFSVHVLGHFRLLKTDRPIQIPPRLRKPLELLQALIAFGGMEVGAGALIDALWPDAEGDAAYHALESALYRLRQLLGTRDAVRMAGRKVSLDRDQFWVDMWEFEQELKLKLSHGAEADALARMDRIRQLYKGHFLEHASERPWALKMRHSLRDRFVRAVRDAAGVCESQGRWQDAAHLYRSALELDSLSEELYRGLMLCHQEMGDHSEALQVYRRCRELLTRLLGVSPSAKTQALYHSVRERAVHADGLADAHAR